MGQPRDNAPPKGGSDERKPVWFTLGCKNRFTERWLIAQRIRDKDSVIEEPCAGKLACTVLKQRCEGRPLHRL